MLQFFNDSDGVGPQSSHMVFDIFNSSESYDDNYSAHITITPGGKAVFNPMNSMYQTSSEITDWSMPNVIFEAYDIHDSSVTSYQVSFIVKGVKFTAERADSGAVTSDDPAVYQGTGLPGSVVRAEEGDEQ